MEQTGGIFGLLYIYKKFHRNKQIYYFKNW